MVMIASPPEDNRMTARFPEEWCKPDHTANDKPGGTTSNSVVSPVFIKKEEFPQGMFTCTFSKKAILWHFVILNNKSADNSTFTQL